MKVKDTWDLILINMGSSRMYKKIKSSWVKHLDFLLADIICTQVSFLIAFLLRHGWINPYIDSRYRMIPALLIVFFICVVFFAESYSGILRRGMCDEIKSILRVNLLLLLALMLYLFTVQRIQNFSRMVFYVMTMLNITMMCVIHNVLKQQLRNKGKKIKNYMLLITNQSNVHQTVRRLLQNDYGMHSLVGIVLLDGEGIGNTIQDIPIVATGETMLEYARVHIVDAVLIDDCNENVDEITEKFVDMGIVVHININQWNHNLLNCHVQSVNGYTVLTSSINSVTTKQLFLKRCIDIIGGVVGVMAMGILTLFVAPIIKIQSKGPVFFQQVRVGKNGRKFTIYKFRSMYMDAEERKKELMSQNKMNGFMFKLDDDPRVFPFGKILRKTSIDEFPQFWNVLKGDMSLVGTRPPTVDEYTQYKTHHKSRLATKPGLTGMWQVSGRSDITDFEEVVKLDNEYIRNWHLGLDIKIIVKTIGVVFLKKGSA